MRGAKREKVTYPSKSTDKNLKFKLGDRVEYTNDYGVKFKELQIIGFFEPNLNCRVDAGLWKSGKRYHISTDCHWSPVTEKSLKLERSK